MAKSKKITTAVIPAAGLGTRFLPLTKSQPKEMLPLVDKPAIQYVVEEAVAAGISDILIITGRGKRAIEDHFDRNFELDYRLLEKNKHSELAALEEIESLANIHYIRQRDALGLGDAVSAAKYHVGNSPFVVMLGDDIMVDDAELLKNMLKDFDESNSSVIALMETKGSEISNYGCVDLNHTKEETAKRIANSQALSIKDLIEKPAFEDAPSNLAVMGRYVFTPEIFECIDDVKIGANGEIQLTDAIAILSKSQDILGRVLSHGRFDIGQKADWIIANVALALDRDDLKDEVRRALLEILEEKQ